MHHDMTGEARFHFFIQFYLHLSSPPLPRPINQLTEKAGYLIQFFAQIGPVLSANVITDRYTGRSKGFGFVEMANDEDAERAKQELNGQSLDGRAIAISEAKPMQPRDSNYSGGGSFGGRRDDR